MITNTCLQSKSINIKPKFKTQDHKTKLLNGQL